MVPTRATKRPTEPKLTTFVRAPPVLPPAEPVGVEVEVVDERTEEGLEREEGGLVEVGVGEGGLTVSEELLPP